MIDKKINPEYKIKIQKLANSLADECLLNAENFHGYSDDDLLNATLIFSHFLMDVLFRENQHIDFNKQCDLATTTGKAIRELIKASTGKDMHKVAKNMGKNK